MAFKRITGRVNAFWMPKAASTVFTGNQLVYANASGQMIPADSTSGDHFGICLSQVAATDANYATTEKIMIDFVSPGDILEVDVPNGDLATSDVGNTCDLDATDPKGIDPDADSKHAVTIVGYVSASKALVRVNSMVTSKNVTTS